MKFFSSLSWDFFRHYLLSRRAGATIRTVAWLCMAGVSIGVMSLVVVISVMNGFNGQIRQRLLAVEPHLVVQMPGAKNADELKTLPINDFFANQKDVQTEIFEQQDVLIRTVDGVFGGAIAKGVEPKGLDYIMRETRKALAGTHLALGPTGESIESPPLSRDTANLEAGEILMGVDLARGLGIFEGDKVTIVPPEALLLPPGEAPPFERVTVKGLIQTNLPDIDGKVFFYGRGRTLATFRDSASREIGYELRLLDPMVYAPLQKKIASQGGKVESWVERNSSLIFALRMEKLAMGTFLGLSAMIASSSIVTVLVLLLTQKRKDIGLLMALGFSQKQTRNLFVRVGLILSSVGIGSGLIAGVVICYIVDRYPIPILPAVYYDSTIPAKVDPIFVFGILAVACVIAFFSAWIPASSTTKTTPSDALKDRQVSAKA